MIDEYIWQALTQFRHVRQFAAFNEALQFRDAMRKLETDAGTSQAQFEAMRKSILSLAECEGGTP